MRVSSLYDQGSAPHREDGMFLADPFFGVLDGVSAPYGPAHPMRKLVGMSGGELVARRIERFFVKGGLSAENRKPSDWMIGCSFTDEIRAVNCEIRRLQLALGVDDDVAEFAGATFAVARVYSKTVSVVQAGDCFALWATRDGVGITRNQVREHDTEMNAEILRIQREIAAERFGTALEDVAPAERGKIRGEMWNRFCAALGKARIQDVNNLESPRCYGLLNGDPRLQGVMFMMKFSRRDLRTLLLFSDGMVPWEAMKGMSDEEVAAQVYADYQEGGLAHLLQLARGIEKRVEAVNYTDSAEATAIALDFSDEK